MGFIHQTDSDKFGIETRNESAYLFDTDPNSKHLFIHRLRTSDVKNEIKRIIMERAGKAFTDGKDEEAKRLKGIAEYVHLLPLESLDRETRSFEASYDWMAELYAFIQSNDSLRKEMEKRIKSKLSKAASGTDTGNQ